MLALIGYSEIAKLGLVVGIAILFSMTFAATVGTTVPIVLRRLDIDTTVATGPFVTTMIDIFGVCGYFLIAKLVLGI